jgi:hypothetical protein
MMFQNQTQPNNFPSKEGRSRSAGRHGSRSGKNSNQQQPLASAKMADGEKMADGNASPPAKDSTKTQPQAKQTAPRRTGNLLKKKVNNSSNNNNNVANNSNSNNIGTNSPVPNTGVRTPASRESPLATKNKTSPGTRNLRRAPAHVAVAAAFNGAKVGADGKLIQDGKGDAKAVGKSGTPGGGEEGEERMAH